ncbi:putative DNA-binding transcriptional regulator YafY [Paenibacillus cellulosilyticus]|uniref:Putative DNA-binding transcriptional regulator YafY n=1 Tax=Paenibacillus cellulosilyticus TaxID=375489 RepID=A0A2V2YP08_9BACL|nr:WYL domain-containing protein [Paenibacillus cellulosilyticus]PWV97878.1 putative DNA-binding transcriptional regulator YafY [Paenibacillus cellulosilyticus]QKS46951.1 WYL domain-containing protein [Paenibacillus cellulosilyticus]
MSNTHRIQWFDQQIREARYPNSNHLAERFEISKRQAQRDIEYMGASLRAPLVYDAKRRGYSYDDSAYVLPHLYMTEDEKRVLKYLVHRYSQYNYDHADTAHRVARLLDRFTDESESELYDRLPMFNADPRMMQLVLLLTEAIKRSRLVQLVYEGEQLTIQPTRLLSRYNDDYVAAYCDNGQEQRHFRLSAIAHATIVEQTAAIASLTNVRASTGNESGAPARKPFTAKVRLVEPLECGETWNGFSSACSDVDPLLYEVDFYDTNAFVRHLMVAEWDELLAPKWLREKLRLHCSAVLTRLDKER